VQGTTPADTGVNLEQQFQTHHSYSSTFGTCVESPWQSKLTSDPMSTTMSDAKLPVDRENLAMSENG
jgi:hypothetical protein